MNHHNFCVCLKGRVQTWVVTCTCSQKSETPFVPLLYEFLLHWKEGKWESHEQDSFVVQVTKPTSQRQWMREEKWFHNIICTILFSSKSSLVAHWHLHTYFISPTRLVFLFLAARIHVDSHLLGISPALVYDKWYDKLVVLSICWWKKSTTTIPYCPVVNIFISKTL